MGVVALGSSSDPAAVDEWSDHDLFLVVEPGAQEAFRTDLGWLVPPPGRVLHAFRETAHGVTAILDGGHLVELAVFDLAELAVARVSRYRVLLDRGGVGERMEAVARASAAPGARGEGGADEAWLAGMFLSGILVGGGRARRGELLAGRAALANAARRLLVLIAREVPADRSALDPFDPHRRFERAYPAVAAEIDQALGRGGAEGARMLLEIAARELRSIPPAVAAAIRARLSG
ncbi:MAG TPA: hypothetical protein VND93_04495 [Myxococcales bacterium]|nr:hypothetical protein [Myxococcales bacterium]